MNVIHIDIIIVSEKCKITNEIWGWGGGGGQKSRKKRCKTTFKEPLRKYEQDIFHNFAIV